MVGFLVLGVLFAVGGGAIDAVTVGNSGNSVSAVNAANQVQTDAAPVSTAVNNYSAAVKACKGQLACVTNVDRQEAAALNTFGGQLRAIPMPSRATAANAALIAAVSRTASIYARIGAATSASQYINTARASGLQQALNQVNQDYSNLAIALGA
jgi:hypothetical protein